MRRSLVWSLLVASVVSLGACKEGSSTAPEGDVIVIDGTVRGTGMVVFYNLEGGFYAIRTDDGVYDPIGGLPAQFRVDGLPVEFEGHIRHGASIHMIGQLLELTQIRVR